MTKKDFKRGNWVIGKDGYLPREPRKVLIVTNKECGYYDPHLSGRKGIRNNGCGFEYLRKATKSEIAKAVRPFSKRKATKRAR